MYLQIKGVTADSRKVRPGYLYVAIKGVKHDGNAYLKEAASRGAAAAVSDQLNSSPYLPVFHVENARRCLAYRLRNFYGSPSERLRLYGVTGTNGKTTTAFMTERILAANDLVSGMIGTVIIKMGQEVMRAELTTPGAEELNEFLRSMVEKGVTHAVMEVSSQGLAQYRVEGLEFAGGVITNLGLDHLDCHADFADYLKAKRMFVEMLGREKPLFINGDDAEVRRLAQNADCQVITYGLGEACQLRAENIVLTAEGSRFEVVRSGERMSFELQVLGLHNVYNALAAIAIALWEKIEYPVIHRALQNFICVERRMEVFQVKGLTVVDDTALNPNSIKAVFAFLDNLPYRKLVVVNALRGKRSPEVNRENAKALLELRQKKSFACLVLTASCDVVGEADRVLPEEEKAFLSVWAGEDRVKYYLTLEEAIDFALKQVKPGDLLVLLGAQGMDAGADLVRRSFS